MFQEIEKQILIILHGGELAVLYCFGFLYLYEKALDLSIRKLV